MNINAGYFQIPTPSRLLRSIDRRLNPFSHRTETLLRDAPLEVRWTGRAERALGQRSAPLTVEMQVYFTCVVKKRVLFHDNGELHGSPVDERLNILFNVVESNSCDPVEFANNFPVKQVFDSPAALKMKPSALEIDFRDGIWSGEFFIGPHGAS
ncbi:MAG: hypothetical protein ABW066_13780 [Sedimenticola sp.]